MLDRGADIEAKAEDGRTPLHSAAADSTYGVPCHGLVCKSRSRLSQIFKTGTKGVRAMSKEFEGCEVAETRIDVLVIPKQDVEFSASPQPKTEEDRTKERDKMIDFIHKKGFEMAMNNPDQRCLLVDEGLGIGIFKSLEEIYDYVKKGYPAADIERYKSSLAADGLPQDLHKLPPEVRERWNELPEDVKQTIREKGADIIEMRKIEETEDGERIVHPDPKFQTEHEKREGTKEEQRREDEKRLEYIQDSGFHVYAFGDGEVESR